MFKVIYMGEIPNPNACQQNFIKANRERGAVLLNLSMLGILSIMVLLSVIAFMSPDEAGDILKRDSQSSGVGQYFAVSKMPVLTTWGGRVVFRSSDIVNSYMQETLKAFEINSGGANDYCLSLARYNSETSNVEVISPYHYEFDVNSINYQLAPCPEAGLSSFALNEANAIYQSLNNFNSDLSSKVLAIAFIPNRNVAYLKFVGVESTEDYDSGAILSANNSQPLPPVTLPDVDSELIDQEDIIQAHEDMMGSLGNIPDEVEDLAYDGGGVEEYLPVAHPEVIEPEIVAEDYGSFIAPEFIEPEYVPVRQEATPYVENIPEFDLGVQPPSYGMDRMENIPSGLGSGAGPVAQDPVFAGSRYDLGSPLSGEMGSTGQAAMQDQIIPDAMLQGPMLVVPDQQGVITPQSRVVPQAFRPRGQGTVGQAGGLAF